ncbi:MAG TPA: ATP-binding cassette domain-containing protein [Verrucomicrobiae bacterium]|nr:ATP-binding cassette domain-containing protein [Verrucomicrobiae bacterium]
MNEPLVRLDKVSKCFQIYQQHKTLFRLGQSLLGGVPLKRELWALREVSLEVKRGEKIGLIGKNGCGKTTLLRVLAGILDPTAGSVEVRSPLSVLFNYSLGLNPYLPVLDNIYLLGAVHGILVSEVTNHIEEIVEFSGLRELLYMQVKDLSAGQKQRLFFSVFAQTAADFLAFDESTTVADMSFRKKAEGYFDRLMDSERTVIIASHEMKFIARHCTRVIWMDSGRIKIDGAPEETIGQFQEFCLENKG